MSYMIREQKIVITTDEYSVIEECIKENHISAVMLVCGNSIKSLSIWEYFEELSKKTDLVIFSDFTPNPDYESVVKGVDVFNKTKCEMIIAVGGGSAIDVAKCIKLYAKMKNEELFFEQEIIPNDIKLIAVPTTAGTGSESTRYAVIYYKGEKQSISHSSCIPDIAILDATVLKKLPVYHKKSTMLDALCHAIEAFWSVNSNEVSKNYSIEAIRLIMKYKDSYLSNEDVGNEKMLIAANLAGKAIDITQTTAGHAMCYKITSLFGIAHGHAAAICLSKLWRYMISNTNRCIDSRGRDYLEQMFVELACALDTSDAKEAVDIYDMFLNSLELEMPNIVEEAHINILKKSVNLVRLKNNPIELDEEILEELYRQILNK